MKLKKQYDSKEDIPEGAIGLYTETDGKFVLTSDLEIEGLSSGGSTPPAPKPKADPRVGEFRDENIRLRKEMDQLKEAYSGLDPEAARKASEALAKIEQEEERNLLRDGKFDEVVARRTAGAIASKEEALKARNVAYEELEKKYGDTRNQLATLTIDNQMLGEIDKQGLRLQEGAREDILNRTRKVFELGEDGKVHSKGTYDDEGNAVTFATYAAKLARESGYLFKGGKGGGSGEGGESVKQTGAKPSISGADPMEFGRNAEKIAKGEMSVGNE